MLFALPVKLPRLSDSKWSKDITRDGYHVRAGQTIFIREDLLPGGIVGHCEKIEGVDKDGFAYSAYLASAWKGKPIPLSDCVTE